MMMLPQRYKSTQPTHRKVPGTFSPYLQVITSRTFRHIWPRLQVHCMAYMEGIKQESPHSVEAIFASSHPRERISPVHLCSLSDALGDACEREARPEERVCPLALPPSPHFHHRQAQRLRLRHAWVSRELRVEASHQRLGRLVVGVP